MKSYSVLTSDLDRRPELREQLWVSAARSGELWNEITETISPDGKITTFAPVMS